MSAEAVLIKRLAKALQAIDALSDELNAPVELLKETEDGKWVVPPDTQVGLDHAASMARKALKGVRVL